MSETYTSVKETLLGGASAVLARAIANHFRVGGISPQSVCLYWRQKDPVAKSLSVADLNRNAVELRAALGTLTPGTHPHMLHEGTLMYLRELAAENGQALAGESVAGLTLEQEALA